MCQLLSGLNERAYIYRPGEVNKRICDFIRERLGLPMQHLRSHMRKACIAYIVYAYLDGAKLIMGIYGMEEDPVSLDVVVPNVHGNGRLRG